MSNQENWFSHSFNLANICSHFFWGIHLDPDNNSVKDANPWLSLLFFILYFIPFNLYTMIVEAFIIVPWYVLNGWVNGLGNVFFERGCTKSNFNSTFINGIKKQKRPKLHLTFQFFYMALGVFLILNILFFHWIALPVGAIWALSGVAVLGLIPTLVYVIMSLCLLVLGGLTFSLSLFKPIFSVKLTVDTIQKWFASFINFINPKSKEEANNSSSESNSSESQNNNNNDNRSTALSENKKTNTDFVIALIQGIGSIGSFLTLAVLFILSAFIYKPIINTCYLTFLYCKKVNHKMGLREKEVEKLNDYSYPLCYLLKFIPVLLALVYSVFIAAGYMLFLLKKSKSLKKIFTVAILLNLNLNSFKNFSIALDTQLDIRVKNNNIDMLRLVIGSIIGIIFTPFTLILIVLYYIFSLFYHFLKHLCFFTWDYCKQVYSFLTKKKTAKIEKANNDENNNDNTQEEKIAKNKKEESSVIKSAIMKVIKCMGMLISLIPTIALVFIIATPILVFFMGFQGFRVFFSKKDNSDEDKSKLSKSQDKPKTSKSWDERMRQALELDFNKADNPPTCIALLLYGASCLVGLISFLLTALVAWTIKQLYLGFILQTYRIILYAHKRAYQMIYGENKKLKKIPNQEIDTSNDLEISNNTDNDNENDNAKKERDNIIKVKKSSNAKSIIKFNRFNWPDWAGLSLGIIFGGLLGGIWFILEIVGLSLFKFNFNIIELLYYWFFIHDKKENKLNEINRFALLPLSILSSPIILPIAIVMWIMRQTYCFFKMSIPNLQAIFKTIFSFDWKSVSEFYSETKKLLKGFNTKQWFRDGFGYILGGIAAILLGLSFGVLLFIICLALAAALFIGFIVAFVVLGTLRLLLPLPVLILEKTEEAFDFMIKKLFDFFIFSEANNSIETVLGSPEEKYIEIDDKKKAENRNEINFNTRKIIDNCIYSIEKIIGGLARFLGYPIGVLIGLATLPLFIIGSLFLESFYWIDFLIIRCISHMCETQSFPKDKWLDPIKNYGPIELLVKFILGLPGLILGGAIFLIAALCLKLYKKVTTPPPSSKLLENINNKVDDGAITPLKKSPTPLLTDTPIPSHSPNRPETNNSCCIL